MRKALLCTAIGLLIAGVAIGQGTQTPAGTPAAPSHVMTAPAELKWGPPPAVFEQNAQMALVSGDPGKPGLYVVRLKMPAGYKIMPHWHPTDEHVTVISGTFALGMGDKLDPATMKELPAGGYALLPAQMHHYAMAKTECTVQVHGMGPFALTYVDPADDPSTRAAAKK
jgi:quercetin dioxygenase-like cupin family protein